MKSGNRSALGPRRCCAIVAVIAAGSVRRAGILLMSWYQPERATRSVEVRMSGEQITFEDFLRIDVRVGRILDVQDFPQARKPAYKLRIDFGALGEKRSSAQIVQNYTPEQLLGRLVLAVVNFPPRQIANFMSEVLVLGVPDEAGNVVLLAPERELPLGGRMY